CILRCHMTFLVYASFFYSSFFFFFFLAEDGIRDFHVTGVQTCALPISLARAFARIVSLIIAGGERILAKARARATRPSLYWGCRSEERRVGKECRLWGAPED